MDVPATLRLWLTIGKPAAVDPLHYTTVPFSLDVALNARVEVMSTRVVLTTTLGLMVAVRVATKLKVFIPDRCNSIAVQPAPNGCSTCELDTSSGWKEWLDNPVQLKPLCDSAGVSHRISLGQAPLIPTLESRATVAVSRQQGKVYKLPYIALEIQCKKICFSSVSCALDMGHTKCHIIIWYRIYRCML